MRSAGMFSPMILVLGIAALLGLALAIAAGVIFIPRRPPPEGPSAVGRAELVLSGSDGRSIPITVWYPAVGDAGGRPVQDAAIAAQAPTPLILFSPGWTDTRTQNLAQVENLASHGFVVVGCDDIGTDPAADPDYGVNWDFTSDAGTEFTLALARRHVERQAARLQDILRALGAEGAGPFAGRLKLDRVGVLGFSIGGTAGMQLAAVEPRAIAVFNLDGGFFDPAQRGAGHYAYFAMSSRESFPPAADLTSPVPNTRNMALLTVRDNEYNAARASGPNGYWAAIDSAGHSDLKDALFALSRHNVMRSPVERGGISDALRAYQLAFFRSTLLGTEEPLLTAAPLNQYVRWVISAPAAAPGAASAQTQPGAASIQ